MLGVISLINTYGFHPLCLSGDRDTIKHRSLRSLVGWWIVQYFSFILTKINSEQQGATDGTSFIWKQIHKFIFTYSSRCDISVSARAALLLPGFSVLRFKHVKVVLRSKHILDHASKSYQSIGPNLMKWADIQAGDLDIRNEGAADRSFITIIWVCLLVRGREGGRDHTSAIIELLSVRFLAKNSLTLSLNSTSSDWPKKNEAGKTKSKESHIADSSYVSDQWRFLRLH